MGMDFEHVEFVDQCSDGRTHSWQHVSFCDNVCVEQCSLCGERRVIET